MNILSEEEQVTLDYMKRQQSNALMCQGAALIECLVKRLESLEPQEHGLQPDGSRIWCGGRFVMEYPVPQLDQDWSDKS